MDGRCKVAEDRKTLQGPPELIIEVLSPGTARARQDRGRKFKLYERFGVKEYWMIDPTGEYAEIWFLEGDRFVRLGVFGPEDTFNSPLLAKDVLLKKVFEY